jgi:hypothetical protein
MRIRTSGISGNAVAGPAATITFAKSRSAPSVIHPVATGSSVGTLRLPVREGSETGSTTPALLRRSCPTPARSRPVRHRRAARIVESIADSRHTHVQIPRWGSVRSSHRGRARRRRTRRAPPRPGASSACVSRLLRSMTARPMGYSSTTSKIGCITRERGEGVHSGHRPAHDVGGDPVPLPLYTTAPRGATSIAATPRP